jgi:3-deoxy-manno-octulosonate cytidylyltransferase (CMP-KDO synthetase)
LRSAIVIPARLGATRLPGKPLATLGNVPLVVWVARQASKCAAVDLIAVATDSPEIAQAVESHGFTAIMTESGHLNGTSRVAEAAQFLAADWVINVQGDEPFIDPRDLTALAQTLRAGSADMATLSRPLTEAEDFTNPNVVKVVCDAAGHALYFSRAPIPWPRSGVTPPPGACRHIGVYGYRREALNALCQAPPHPLEVSEGLEQLRALAMGLKIAVLSANTDARGIDTEEDLTWARARVERLGEAAFP